MSSLCGGVISESQHKKNVEQYGVWADMMAFVMPDDKYEEYLKIENRKERSRFFDEHARSQI